MDTIASIDDSVEAIFKFLNESDLVANTIVIYTSDQGFFLDEHVWFDKRFIYEQTFEMPFLIRHPNGIKPGQVNEEFCCNVDFAPTFLDYGGIDSLSYIQGDSLRTLLESRMP